MIVAVADAGPLIHFAEIDSLELFTVLDELLVPVTVHDELRAGGLPSGLSDLDYEVVESREEKQWTDGDLDAGETAALSVASGRNAVLLTDDLDARRAANDADIAVHGSVGLVALAHGRGEIERSTAVDLMHRLQDETSLFVTDTVIEKGIDILDEEQ